MKDKLQDAHMALGLGFAFFAYGAWILYDWWYERRKANIALRAKLILNPPDATSRITEELNIDKETEHA